jgi:hypothetical protein
MSFDTTRLVAQMNIKGSLPDGRFTDQELLDFAYDSLLSEIVPAVLEAREEFFVTYTDFTITANQAAYIVPPRAINGVLREVKLIRGTQIIDLERRDLEEITDTTSGTPDSFYVSGNSLMLYPTPSVTSDTLRVYYFMRPSKLVSVAECAVITAISTNTVTITIPTGWTTTNTFDVVRGRAHFDILGSELVATSVGSGTIVFSTTVPSTMIVGDYITLAEETCFPALPPEGHVALVQSAVTSALESMGDPNAGSSAQKTSMLLETFKGVLKTRIQGAPKALGRRLL